VTTVACLVEQPGLCLRQPLPVAVALVLLLVSLAGPNLPFYTPFLADSSSSSPLLDSSVTGLEPNTEMWGYAQEAAASAGLQQQQLRLVEGDAQQMPFHSDSFDAAVMTLVREAWTL
jgi:hypothetical protein